MRSPLLPRITHVRLHNFHPLFSAPVDTPVSRGLLLVVGGNGLGKTTILQSIAYCVGGLLDDKIETRKELRWGLSYFQTRLKNWENADVEVEFFLGKDHVLLQRGFRNKLIRKFVFNGQEKGAQNNDADAHFARFLLQAGYRTEEDFRFVFHKLCYLPELRPNIAWDLETQTRLLMILSSDIIDESEFKRKRGLLKEFDSKRRHAQVAINKAAKALEELYEVDDAEADEEDDAEVTTKTNGKVTPEQHVAARDRVAELIRKRLALEDEVGNLRRSLGQVTDQVTEIQEKLARAEESFILSQIDALETHEAKLAIHKLLFHKLCPACGNHSSTLAEQAKRYASQGCCPLCGTDKVATTHDHIPQLDDALTEKLAQRRQLEYEILSREGAIREISSKAAEFQRVIDEFQIDQPLAVANLDLPDEEEVPLKKRLKGYRRDYTIANNRFEELRDELSSKYSVFEQASAKRFERLASLYKKYATEFLGTECELEPTQSSDRFLSLNLYVPKFNSTVRASPESCSEAQRFFLDIAMRMALIDLAASLSRNHGTFICETPENALDLAYIDNVAAMFRQFREKGHSLVASSNIQPGSLAKPMLSGFGRKKEKRESLLNLLEIGLLSDVQEEMIDELQAEVNRILS